MVDLTAVSDNWFYAGIAIGIAILTYLLIRLSLKLVDIDSRTKTIRVMNKERITVDVTRHQFLKHALPMVLFCVGAALIIYFIPPLRAASKSWLAGAGIIALVIGFASQQAISNLVAGVFIAIFKPFRVGDWITVGDDSGIVEDINLRHTQIVDFNNKRIIIPNSIISNERIHNADIEDRKVCEFLEVRISFDSDVDKAKGIIIDECSKHPLFLDNRTSVQKRDGTPPVYVYVYNIGDYFVTLRAMVWSRDSFSGWYMRVSLLENIKKRFEKDGVEIPFPSNNWFAVKKRSNGGRR